MRRFVSLPPMSATTLRDFRMAIERRTTLGIGGPVLVDPDTHGALDAIERRMGRD